MKPRHCKPNALYRVALATIAAYVCAAQAISAGTYPAVAIPDTPAGKQLAAWLEAFNTGKRETIRQFIADHFDKPPTGSLPIDAIADQNVGFFHTTRGFEVRKIASSSSAAITAFVQAKLTGYWMKIQVFVTAQPPNYVIAQPPYNIVGFGCDSIEAPVDLLPHKKLTENEIRAKLDALITKLVTADAFSGTILVAKNGKPFYQRACGVASRAWNAPNRIDTKFNLASMNKMFTAVAIAQLVEQGKLSYEDTIGKILPGYPNKEVAQKVTVRHLLTHTSGLTGARASVEKMRASPPQALHTVKEMLASFVNEPLQFEPGTKFDYSNNGYTVLGAIIEKVSGQDYFDYIRDHIYKPAGMTNSDSYELDTDPPNLATGYMDGPDRTRRNNVFRLSARGGPAGGGYSNAEDLLKFSLALRNHKLISAKSLDIIWTATDVPGHEDGEYGYGFEIRHYNGTRIVGHGGGWDGVTNRFDMFPDLGYTVAILTNIDDDPASISNKLREWLTQRVANEPPPAFTLSASVSPSTVPHGNPVTITVTVKDAGGEAFGSILDMEVKDAAGAKVNQQFTTGQSFTSGQTKTYTYSWTPSTAGAYTVDLGAFGANWATKYTWNDRAATIIVN